MGGICLAGAEVDYIIGVGDKIAISLYKNEDLNSTVVVRPDGKISFPLIGEVVAAGKTPLELRQILTEKLSEFINAPEVMVNLIGMENFTVYVYGPKSLAGQKNIRGNTNMLQFFATLDTLSDDVDLKESSLIRNNKKEAVNFYKLLREGDLTQNVYLKPGDVIFIKELAAKPVIQETNQFKNKVKVIGEVRSEGNFDYKEGMTVLDAILMAGGFYPIR